MAWSRWLASQRDADRVRRDSTADVYQSIWDAFTAWSIGSDPVVTLAGLTAEDLERFLQSRTGHERGRTLTAAHAWRIVNLIERVLTRHALVEDTQPSSAVQDLLAVRADIRQANTVEHALPEYLPPDEARRLVVYLSAMRPRASGLRLPSRWQELRNRASVALMLGAGLTPGDVRMLGVEAVVSAGGKVKGVPWKIIVPADGTRAEHEAPLARWAGQLLRYWLDVRTDLGFPADPDEASVHWLFPSNRRGSPWSKVGHWNTVNSVLEQAGVMPASGGSFRLRHTFALRQLRRGTLPADVARWMGIANVEEMERYRRILTEPEDVV